MTLVATSYPYVGYGYFKELLSNRRKDKPYRRIDGCFFGSSSLAIREALDPATAGYDAIEVVDYYKAKRAHTEKKPSIRPESIVTLYPDRFIFHGHYFNLSCINRLVAFLTDYTYGLQKYRRLTTNATHILVPELVAKAQKNSNNRIEKYVYFCKALDKAYDSWWGNRRELFASCDHTKSRNGFTYTRDIGVTSFEPVLTRSWVPEKRREYLHTLKDLRKYGNVRIKIGAFDDLINGFYQEQSRRSWAQRRNEKLALQDELAKKLPDSMSNETYRKIMRYAMYERGYWVRNDDYEKKKATYEYGLNKLKESIRLGIGAVVYS